MNLTDKPIDSLTAVIEFRTADGTFVKSEMGIVEFQPLLPGQTSPWKVMTTHNPAIEKVGLRFKRMFSGAVSARSK